MCIHCPCVQKCDYSHGLGASDLEFVKAMAVMVNALQPERKIERQPCATLDVDATMLARAAAAVANQESTALQRSITTAAFVALACHENVRARSN